VQRVAENLDSGHCSGHPAFCNNFSLTATTLNKIPCQGLQSPQEVPEMNEIYRKFWLIVFTRYLWQGHAFAYQQGYSSIHHHINYKGHKLYSTLHTSHPIHPRYYKSKSLLLSHEDGSVDGNIHNSNNNVDMKPSFLKRIRNKVGDTASDGLTTSQQLAKMGLSALLSYGFVSNMSLCVTVSLAWFSFNKKVGFCFPSTTYFMSSMNMIQINPCLVYTNIYIYIISMQ